MTTNLLEKFNSLKETAAPASAVRGGNVKPNRYGGKCEKCTRWVDPGAGSFHKGDEGWIVFHVECPVFPSRDFTPGPSVRSDYHPIQHGTYTVNGDEGHATFRISHQ